MSDEEERVLSLNREVRDDRERVVSLSKRVRDKEVGGGKFGGVGGNA